MPRKVVDLLYMYVWGTPIQRYMGGHSSFYYVDNLEGTKQENI